MATVSDPKIIDFPGMHTAVLRREQLPASEIAEFMDTAYTALGMAIGQGAFLPAGPAFSRYDGIPGEFMDVEVGFPVASAIESITTPNGTEVLASTLPACQLAIAQYTGPYEGLGEAWRTFLTTLNEQGHTAGIPFWEAYETEPTPETDPETLVTGLAVPIGPVSEPEGPVGA